jgi:hypothetical protein
MRVESSYFGSFLSQFETTFFSPLDMKRKLQIYTWYLLPFSSMSDLAYDLMFIGAFHRLMRLWAQAQMPFYPVFMSEETHKICDSSAGRLHISRRTINLSAVSSCAEIRPAGTNVLTKRILPSLFLLLLIVSKTPALFVTDELLGSWSRLHSNALTFRVVNFVTMILSLSFRTLTRGNRIQYQFEIGNTVILCSCALQWIVMMTPLNIPRSRSFVILRRF